MTGLPLANDWTMFVKYAIKFLVFQFGVQVLVFYYIKESRETTLGLDSHAKSCKKIQTIILGFDAKRINKSKTS